MLLEHPSLLITDDDLEFRQTLRGVFEPQGFQTLLAGDGEEALQIVRTHQVHLVLLDMHMPKLTGLETIRLVKQFNSRIPWILMSADLDDFLVEQARRLQAFQVLSKPVTFRQLTSAVQQALLTAYNWPGGEKDGPA